MIGVGEHCEKLEMRVAGRKVDEEASVDVEAGSVSENIRRRARSESREIAEI